MASEYRSIIAFSAREARAYQRRYPGSIVRHVFARLGMVCIWL